MTGAPERISYPSPSREKVAAVWLLAGLAIPSAAWTLEMLVGFGVSSNACLRTPVSALKAGFGGECTLLLALQIVCLAAAIASGWMSYRHWGRVRREKQGRGQPRSATDEGRTRFLAIAGMMMAATFAVAILFNMLEPIVIPSCWSLR